MSLDRDGRRRLCLNQNLIRIRDDESVIAQLPESVEFGGRPYLNVAFRTLVEPVTITVGLSHGLHSQMSMVYPAASLEI